MRGREKATEGGGREGRIKGGWEREKMTKKKKPYQHKR